MRKFVEPDVADNPLYHDTWKLLKKYRDVVWSLELSVQHVRTKFEIEYGTSIEDFLDSVYLAGADLAGSDIEHHAKCIERSHKMLKLLDSAVELLRMICSELASPGSSPRISRAARCRYPPGTCPASHRF